MTLSSALRQLHSTLEVLHGYAFYHLGIDADPVDIRIVDVLESVVAIAANSCNLSDNLECELNAISKQFKAVVEQIEKEVQA